MTLPAVCTSNSLKLSEKIGNDPGAESLEETDLDSSDTITIMETSEEVDIPKDTNSFKGIPATTAKCGDEPPTFNGISKSYAGDKPSSTLEKLKEEANELEQGGG